MSKQATPMKNPTTYLTYEELIALEGGAKTYREWMLVSLLWRCGLRITEAITLTRRDFLIDDIDPENSVIVVYGKGGKYRRVPLNTSMIPRLKTYFKKRRLQEDGYIFPSRRSRSGHLTRQFMAKLLNKMGNRVGVTKDVGGRPIHPHTLRHSLAIFLVKRGVPIEKIRMILGHSSLASTTYYLQFSKIDLAEDYHEAFKVEENGVE